MSTLSKRIRYLRERRDISQKDFAKKIGVSNVVLNRYESGDRKPDGEMIANIAQVLGTTSDYLLGLTDDPTPTWELPTGISEDWFSQLDEDRKNFLKQLVTSEAFALSGDPEQFMKDFEAFVEFKKFQEEFDKKKKKGE